MLAVLEITVPVYLLILIGFLSVRMDWISRGQIDVLAFFVVNFALPALLFQAIIRHPILTLQHVELFQVYTLASLVVFLGVLLLTAVFLRRGFLQGTKLAMGTAFSNSAFMGFPIAERFIGQQAGDMLVIYVAVENIVLLPLALTLLSAGGARKKGLDLFIDVLSGVFRKPLILAIIAGLACSGFTLKVPDFVLRFLDLLSGAASPVALFYIGGVLCGLKLGHMIRDIMAITLAKLLLHPLMIAAAAILMAIDHTDLGKAAILNAAMPMFSIYPILCRQYDREGLCAASLVVATTLSFFSISCFLWWVVNSP